MVTQEVSKTLNDKNTAYFRVPDIITAAAGSTATIPAARLRDVMWFAIEYGGSQKMFYIVDAPAYLSFSFCNIFNVEETIDIAASSPPNRKSTPTPPSLTAASGSITASRGAPMRFSRPPFPRPRYRSTSSSSPRPTSA